MNKLVLPQKKSSVKGIIFAPHVIISIKLIMGYSEAVSEFLYFLASSKKHLNTVADVRYTANGNSYKGFDTRFRIGNLESTCLAPGAHRPPWQGPVFQERRQVAKPMEGKCPLSHPLLLQSAFFPDESVLDGTIPIKAPPRVEMQTLLHPKQE